MLHSIASILPFFVIAISLWSLTRRRKEYRELLLLKKQYEWDDLMNLHPTMEFPVDLNPDNFKATIQGAMYMHERKLSDKRIRRIRITVCLDLAIILIYTVPRICLIS